MFDALLALWNSMTPKQRADKIAALKKITTLKSMCEARGECECDVQKLKIVIFKNTDEVKELVKAFRAAGIEGMKIIKKEV